MTAAMFLIRAGLILLFLFVFIWIILPDITKKEKLNSLDDLENKSKDLVKQKQEIRGATKKTQEKINNITKNLEK